MAEGRVTGAGARRLAEDGAHRGVAMRERWERARGGKDRWPHRCARLGVAVLSLVLVAVATPAQAQQVRYVYDVKGQLIVVIGPDGSAAT